MNLFPLFNSLRIAVLAGIIVFFLGLLLGYYVRKCPRVLKGILDVILTLPLVLPPTVCGYLLILTFGPKHPLGQFLDNFGVRFYMDWKGGIIASAFVAFPLMYRTVRASFESFDNDLIYAAKTLGLSNTYIFWHIIVPNIKSGLVAGFVLAFARALGEYGATNMLIGYNKKKTATISTTVAYAFNNNDNQTALIWTIFNVVISAIILIAINIFESKEKAKKGLEL